MKKVTMYRFGSTDEGTFGLMTVDGKFWHSLELPDRENKPNISCVPIGKYTVKQRYSPSFRKNLYEVKSVRGRSYILIHGANFAGDEKKGFQTHLQGCITLGKQIGRANNKYKNKQRCVFSSRVAINEFEAHLNREPFELEIKEA